MKTSSNSVITSLTKRKYAEYTQARQEHWDGVARRRDHRHGWDKYYHRRLSEIYQFLVSPGRRVLELGCGEGDLLAAVKPRVGFGVDFSSEMLKLAVKKYPAFNFIQADVHEVELNQDFDIIILSDLLNDMWDVQMVLKHITDFTTPSTRIIINSFSHLWQIPLTVARWLGLATPNLPQNWLTVEDTTNLLQLTGYEVIRTWPEIIWPLPTPLVDKICNRFLAKLWPFKHLGLTNIIMARPAPDHRRREGAPKVSVVVPARNEEGNIRHIFERVPIMGSGTELIFVEGHSQDNTYEAIEAAMVDYPDFNPTLVKQTGIGKGDAVRKGFALASGDILMILDADLTVPPEDLIRFYEALQDGIGEFVNGVRLVYPMEDQAMRYLNYIGNKFFGSAFSWLLGQPIKDTLCGTKVLWRTDYERIAANRNYFGDFDPFGDFDLLLGAVKQNLKIVDLPIRYEERTYGSTNIQRWRHGLLLLKMVIFAARRLKFV